jgi:hypothetical protein
MQKGKLLIGLFGLDANKEFHYTKAVPGLFESVGFPAGSE